VLHRSYYTIAIYYKSLSVGCLLSRLRWHFIPSSTPVLVVQVGDYHGAAKLFDRGPNSRLPGHWRTGYSVIYVTGSSQCCCTAVHNRKRGVWKNVQAIWWDGLNWPTCKMQPAGRSLTTPGLVFRVVCHSISVFRFDCFIVENVLSHTYVLPNVECIVNAKSFSLANLSQLTNFQKLSAISRTVSIVRFY